ncbi:MULTISPECIES: amidohydrolase [Jonquetella]|uniref:Amidohydrolase, imidazolonepropionase n=1 Tax=Jonquetella anthropi DSM 22815 TaxID=885272 RepID=H0UMP3_9BACT|nr:MULTISPECIES: amidohydrolase [Jonquetella]EEX49294.1 amidohydrolase family protein [Jonquetella anthropi E3_33 E1]EHM13746.1 amidohydrolase, imidazolonepropionase [Jonquetella anthropi DSM 22815]ERL23959.1 amidohydrolase family protein [Jonquetella sp. BV3C21]
MLKLIYNVTVEPVDRPTIKDGMVLVRDGKILSVGQNVSAPEGTERIDGHGGILTPGLVDAHTHIGSCPEGMHYSMTDENEMTSPVTPQVRIIDSVYPFDRAFVEARSGGVTTVQTLPGSGNVIGGRGAVLKTVGTVVDQMAVKAESCMKAALGENPIGVYKERHAIPSTRMGNAAVMRTALQDAKNYMDGKKRNAAKEESDRDAWEVKLDMEELALVLERRINFSVHAHRADDICTAVRIAKEFDLKLTIEHCTEGHMIAPYLAACGVKAACGPALSTRTKPELDNQTWRNMSVLRDAGVHFCIITDHPVIPLYSLILNASLAANAGLTKAEALRAVTLSGAEHLDLQDRLGSITEGKDADLVLWNGDPLDSLSSVDFTMIGGEICYRRGDTNR